jgi:hypothetical protein
VDDRTFGRLDAVEIKVTVPAARAFRARTALGLRDDRGERRRLYFCEAVSRPAGQRSLLERGVILRLRQRGGGPDDSTVRLRPARRSRLTSTWTEAGGWVGERLRVEADWSGGRRVLAASLVADVSRGGIADLLAGRRTARPLFTERQRRFLRECAGIAVDFDALAPLGPISARRWGHLVVGGFPAAAEQWGIGDGAGDLLEFSTRVERDGAEIAQLGFEAALRVLGVDPEDGPPETKTGHFLRVLGASADQTPS